MIYFISFPTTRIIHADLKPDNFILVRGYLKLIDFGVASKIQVDMTSVLKDVTAGTSAQKTLEAKEILNPNDIEREKLCN